MAERTEKALSKKMQTAVALLEERYSSPECALEYEGEAWKLLVMGRLSAQCTDARVNIVCKELFAKYPTAEALANADISDIESIVRPCGLYKTKAKNIKDSCALLVNEYSGILPDTMDGLLKFPGVGRKIANLLLGDIYKKPAIVADTHCIRICGRLGFYDSKLKDPYKVEQILSRLCEPKKQSDFCHRLVWFGREICSARNPKCGECPLKEICKTFADSNKTNSKNKHNGRTNLCTE